MDVLDCLKFPPLISVPWACADDFYEFLTMVIEGVVHSIHKVVIRSSFSVIQRHKVS